MCLKWRIHFEFIVLTSPLKGVELETASQGDELWQGPGSLETETMQWDVPVQVLPTLPSQAENPATSNIISLLQF